MYTDTCAFMYGRKKEKKLGNLRNLILFYYVLNFLKTRCITYKRTSIFSALWEEKSTISEEN